VPYTQVSLPVLDDLSQLLGFVAFTIGTSHIFAASTQSAEAVGLVLTVFGAVLFSIPATGLPNRQSFSTEVEARLRRCDICRVGYVDADRFKLINDTYGHSVDDAFLKHIVTLPRTAFGEDVLAARFGGDEFTFALHMTCAAEADEKLEELRTEAAQ